MKKQLLFLGAFTVISFGVFAQNNANPDNVKVWLKPAGGTTQTGLNGYMPTKVDTNQWYNFTDESANFYVVFRSFSSEKTDLVDYNFACFDASLHTGITDPRIPTKDLMQRKLQTGAIFKHSLNLPSSYINPTDSKSFFTVKENAENQIYELMYYDTSFESADHQRVQTYLSLKYGISLLEKNNYVNRYGESVWNIGLNRNYNEHIFGLARIDDFGLMQKQSVNSLQPILTVTSLSDFADEEYMLLGDNAGKLTFVENENEMILDRQYVYQNHGSEKNIVLKFDYTQIEDFDTDKIYVLRINHGSTEFDVEKSQDYLGRIADGNLIFDNVTVNDYGLITLTNVTNTASFDEMEWAGSEKMEIYPNPVEAGGKFHIDLNFNQSTDVDVYIYQVNGKLISKNRLNAVTQQTFEHSVTTAGNYLVMVYAGGKLNTFKLLVK